MASKGKKTIRFLENVTLPDCEDNEEDDGIADVPPVPSDSEGFTALSKSLRWLEAQDDCHPTFLQIVHRQQQNVAIRRSTKPMQRCITSFFC